MENRRSPFVKLLSLLLSIFILSVDVGLAADQEKKEVPVKAAETVPPQISSSTQVAVEVVLAGQDKSSVVSPQASASNQIATEIASAETELPTPTPVDPGNVTVNFKQADIRTVLSYIADVSGIDIVTAPEVKGVIDLKLTNKPWQTVLDLIMRNYGLAYERNGDIIRVITLDKLQQEELVTQTFSLDYGNAKEVIKSLEPILSVRGKITFDNRTNMAIVTDMPTVLYKIGEVIKNLDKMTAQILIEARVIETTLGKDEKLGIDWDIKITAAGAKRPTTVPFDYFNADSKYIPLVQTGSSITTTPVGGAGTTITNIPGLFPTGVNGPGNLSKGFPFVDFTQSQFTDSFKFGTLDFSEFRAVLEMLKRREDTDIVANPRIATLNNREAVINVGETVNLPKFERNSQTGKMEITGYIPVDLGTILKVTPNINYKNEIIVTLNPEISRLLPSVQLTPDIVAPRFAMITSKTQVIVKDGDTIFIGGLIQEVNEDVDKRVPIIGDLLGDVPYLGLLVARKEKRKTKREIIFFVTVNIIQAGKVIANSPKSENSFNPMFSDNREISEKDTKKKNKWFWQK